VFANTGVSGTAALTLFSSNWVDRVAGQRPGDADRVASRDIYVDMMLCSLANGVASFQRSGPEGG
jgi:hypothetical protein